jgi:two-component system nitrate/nitrite response regulator NarL
LAALTTGPNVCPHPVIRLAIVAEVRLYRDGLRQILCRRDDIEIVLTAADGQAALPRLTDAKPDVVLFDVRPAEAQQGLRELAAARSSFHVVALGVADDEDDIVMWAEAGVDGYVTSNNSVQEAINVILSVARDEMPCSPRAAAALLKHIAVLANERSDAVELTTRELQIVRLIERGLSNKEIGRQLCIELATVKNHVHNILAKLEVGSRREAVAHVRRSVGVV